MSVVGRLKILYAKSITRLRIIGANRTAAGCCSARARLYIHRLNIAGRFTGTGYNRLHSLIFISAAIIKSMAVG